MSIIQQRAYWSILLPLIIYLTETTCFSALYFKPLFNHPFIDFIPFVIYICLLYIFCSFNLFPSRSIIQLMEVKMPIGSCSVSDIHSVTVSVYGLCARSVTFVFAPYTTIREFIQELEFRCPDVKFNVYYFTVGRIILDTTSPSMTLNSLGLAGILNIFAHLRVSGGSTSENEVIDLTSDGEENRIKISPRIFVDHLHHITSAPEYWSIPKHDERSIAYIIDLRDNPPTCVRNGQKTMDAFIKQECQDSWRGSTGSVLKSVRVFPLDQYSLDGIECRRSTLYCNGAYICNFASPGFLQGFKRWDAHRQTRNDALIQAEQDRRRHEASSVTARTISFYRGIISE
ncbi:hypothetical protein BDQ17DRAFT_769475 [Cyathus striatus]|nr:hypothetical protein BDQ17DRAFT_769475 [Cyathus striatus]